MSAHTHSLSVSFTHSLPLTASLSYTHPPSLCLFLSLTNARRLSLIHTVTTLPPHPPSVSHSPSIDRSIALELLPLLIRLHLVSRIASCRSDGRRAKWSNVRSTPNQRAECARNAFRSNGHPQSKAARPLVRRRRRRRRRRRQRRPLERVGVAVRRRRRRGWRRRRRRRRQRRGIRSR